MTRRRGFSSGLVSATRNWEIDCKIRAHELEQETQQDCQNVETENDLDDESGGLGEKRGHVPSKHVAMAAPGHRPLAMAFLNRRRRPPSSRTFTGLFGRATGDVDTAAQLRGSS